MTTISAPLSSAWNALASLLDNSAYGSSAAPVNQIGDPPNGGNAITDSVDLSDNAKAFLARAQSDQAALEELTGSYGAPNGIASAGQAPPGYSITSAISNTDNQLAYLQAQQAAHTQADGTIQSWSTSASDVFNVASSPQQIEPQLMALAQAFPGSYPGLAEAIQNGTVTVSDARNVPGLNFQNSFAFQGGEGGSGNSSEVSFNSSLPMFNSPNVQTVVMDNGTVVSWPTTAAQQTAS